MSFKTTLSFFVLLLLLGLSLDSNAQCPRRDDLGASFSEVPPGCNVTTQRSMGSGTWLWLSLTQGAQYEVSTCGSSFDTQLSVWKYDGNANNFYTFNDDNGPWCSGTNASLTVTPAAGDWYRFQVNRFNCQGHDFTGVSAILKYRQIPPTLSVVAGDQNNCSGETTTIRASQAFGSWSVVAGPLGYGLTASGSTDVIYTAPNANGTNTIRYSIGNCTVDINVNTYLYPSVSLSGPTNICAGSTATFTASASVSGYSITNYEFMKNSAVVQSGASTTYSTTTAGAINVRVTSSGNGCQTISNQVSLNVNALPTANAISCTNCIPTNSFCFGSTATLQANVVANCGTISTYEWFLNGSPVSGGATYVASAPGTYTVKVTNTCAPNTCSATSAGFVLSQNPQIIANAGGDRTLCPVPPGNFTTLGGSPTASGGTAGYSYAWSPSGSGANPSYTNIAATGNYTVTVTDSRGCTASDITVVTVGDVTLPTVSCPANITRNTDLGLCSSVTATTNATYSDNCSATKLTWAVTGATPLFSPATGINYVGTQTFNKGSNTVTYTVTDQSGNTRTCSYSVTVNDNELPTVSCPANITRGNDNNLCSAVVFYGGAGGDNCPGLAGAVISGLTSGSAFPVGITTNVFRVTDAAGLTATCSFTVTVNDNQNPTITCPANITQGADPGGCTGVVSYTVSSSDNCPGVSSSLVSGPPSGASFSPGLTSVSWKATDAKGHTATCSFTVFIADFLPPTISCPANITVFNTIVSCGAIVSYSAPVAADNCVDVFSSQTSGLASGSFFAVGTTTNVFQAEDLQGNTATCSFTVRVIDNKPPTALCKNLTVDLSAAGAASITAAQANNGSSDECGIASLSINTGSFGCANVGNNSVTLTVTDVNGNSSTCLSTVLIRDVTNPVAVCRNLTIQLSAGGSASITTAQVNNGTSDACGFTLTLSNSSFGCGNVGGNTVTLTATDPSGNTGTCTSTITVQDVTNPVAACKNITVQLNAAGSVSITASQVDNGSSDACGVTLTAAPTSFTCANVGSANIVTLTVKDPSLNSATCISTVTVRDLVPPTALCKNITVDLNASGSATITATQIDNVSSDACGIASRVASKTSFNCTNVGANTVTLTVTDVNGNSSTCNSSVLIRDVTPPNAICQNITVQLNAAGSGSTTAALVNNGSTDACGVATLAVFPTDFGCVDVGANGINQVVLTVTDFNGNQNTCIANVDVQDITPPVAICQNIAPLELDFFGYGSVSANGVTGLIINNGSTDACGIESHTLTGTTAVGSFTNATDIFFNCNDVASGLIPVVMTVTDVNGNTSTCSATVDVIDNIPPVIECSNKTVNNDPGLCKAFVSIPSANITDNCLANGSTITNSFNGTSDASGTYNVGSTNVTWTVTDNFGNTSTCLFTVTVVDNEPPTSMDPPNQFFLANPGVCYASAIVQPLLNVNDNCGVFSVVNSHTLTNNASGNYPDGITVVQWTITDIYGNFTTKLQFIAVIDLQTPTLVAGTCPGPITVGTDPGVCRADVSIPVPTYTDNCGIGFILLRNSSFQVINSAPARFTLGTHTVTWVALDIHNNQNASCSVSVTVVDTEAPVITCPANQNKNTDPNVCEAVVGIPVPVTTDNCTVQSVTNTKTGTNNATGTYTLGTTTVTYTVTDASGNTATCAFTVTVTDVQKPTITCPAAVTTDSDPGDCSASVAFSVPATSDNCGVATVLNNFNNTGDASGTYPVGSTTVTWTVTDVNGNTKTCTHNVTVNDYEDPAISCPADVFQSVDAGVCGAYVTSDASITSDNCGVDLVINDYTGTDDASGDYIVGPTTVTWIVVDIHGLISMCEQTVTIVDDENPAIVCAPAQTQSVDAGLCSADVTVTGPTYSDNCQVDFILNDFTGTEDASGTYGVTTTTVTWIVLDIYGNVNFCEQNITVVDDEVPSITCADDQTQTADAGECQASVTVTSPATDDNCGVDFVINDKTGSALADDIYPVGTTTVTWIVVDINGNTAECTQDITVTDDEAPTFACSDAQTQTADAGVCNAAVTVASPYSEDDNCGVASVTNDFNNTADASDTYPVGTTTITWTIEDIHGNTSTCQQDITITDDEDPTITCAADQSQNTDAGVCEATVNVTAPASDDNCSVSSVLNDYNGTSSANDVYPIGMTTITWTVTDIHGHTASCTQDITISDIEDPSITCAADQIQTADAGECEAGVAVTGPATDDNCGVATIENDRNNTADASGDYPVGTTTLTWTVTDIHGNSSQCTQDITVNDNENPTISCPANVNQNTDLNVCVAAVTIAVPSTDDNCGVASVVNSKNGTNNASGSYTLGTTSVTYTVTDIHGNSTSCSFTVIITDAQLPAITCPSNKVKNNTINTCEATFAIGVPATGDNCGVASVVNNYNSTNNASDDYPVGVTTVTYTVTDVNGNSTTCSFTVTVNDVQKPTFACPTAINQVADAGACEAEVTFPEPIPSDNCGMDTIYNDYNLKADGSDIYPVGTTTLLWTAIDEHGNTSTCLQTITISDNQDPTIACEPGMAQTSDAGECYATVLVIAPAVDDNCGISNLVNSINGTNDASGQYAVGVTTITWTVTDLHGRQVSCIQSITVTDDEDPTITCPANITQTTNPTMCVASVFIPLPVTGDNCGVDIYGNDYNGWSESASGIYIEGVTTVEYRILDIHGNLNSCTFTVTIVDNENPTIACPANITQTADAGQCNADVTIAVPATGDNCGISTVVNSKNGTNDASSNYIVGTTTVVYTVTDIHNNTNTCSFTVTVTDNEKPSITCPADVMQTADPGVCEAVVSIAVPATGDNCGVSSVVNDKNNTDDASDTYAVGTESVTYTVTDIYGNTTACLFTVTITDNEAPSITCPDDITQTADAGECEAYVTIPVPAIDDNCANDMLLNDYTYLSNASADYPVGTTTVTYGVSDIHDNWTDCTFEVTVTDNENPTITCPANQVHATDPGVCTSAFVIAIPGTDDNCGVASIVNTFNSTNNASDTYPIGTTSVTYTVTDIHGNETTCDFTVTVNDQQVPTITCPGNIIQTADAGLCTAAVTVPVPPAYADNCSVFSVLNDYNGTANASDVYPVGVTIVVWTVTDGSGNITTCPMSILVFDDEDPVIYNCPADINVIAQPDDCDPQVFWTAPTASDNCSYTLTSNYHPGDEFDVDPGSFAVNYIAVDPSGNTATCNFVVNVDPTPLVLTYTTSQFACGFNISCNGVSDGSIDLTVDGACLAYSYTWTGPNGFTASTEDITNLGPGEYCYTVTDSRIQGYPGNGQSTNGCITLTEADELVASGVVPEFECGYEISCNGENDGSIDVTVNGGCTPYTYTWTTPNGSGLTAGAEDQVGLTRGVYRVLITDPNGCSQLLTFLLEEPAELVIADLSSPADTNGFNVSCFGASDGEINLEVDGGADCLPYTYQWTGPDSVIITTITNTTTTTVTGNAILSGLGGNSNNSSNKEHSGGHYDVCNISNSDYATGAPNNIGAEFNSIGDLCVFELAHELPAGTSYTISWRQKPGQSGTSSMKVYESQYGVLFGPNAASPANTTTETYFNQTFTTGAATRYIWLEAAASSDFQVDAITYSFTQTTTTTSVGTTTGGAFSSTSEDLTGLQGGTYNVTVTDANGCSVNDLITLTQPAALDLGICSNQTVLFGYYPENVAQITTNVTGALGPYNYYWSTGETTPSIIVAPTSTTTYTLTVTSSNGCIGYASHTVTVIDIRCGSSLDHVTMCDLTNRNYCVKESDVPIKLTNYNFGGGKHATTTSGSYVSATFTASTKVKYLKIDDHDNADFEIDAITYTYPGTMVGYAIGWTPESGAIVNGDNLLGLPDGLGATFNDNGDKVIVKLKDEIPQGTIYTVIWRRASGQSGTSDIDVHESSDNGWKLGSCSMAAIPSSDCPEPVIPPGTCSICHPDGQIKLMLVKYYGASGATVRVRNNPQQAVFQVFFNVQNGDELVVNGTFNNGSKLDYLTYLEVVGSSGPYAVIPTDCANGHGADIVGRTYGDFKVLGLTDNKNNTCGMDAPCACSGGISFLGLIYNGPAGATVKVYAKDNHVDLLGTYSNLQPGDSIVVRADVLNLTHLNSKTYFELVGYIPDIDINTSCADYLPGMEYGPLTVYGYVDKEGQLCNMPPPPACPCDGGIASLTIDYDVFDSLSIADATVKFWADQLHTTLIATFTDVDPGEVIVVSASGLPGGVFGSITFVQIVGSSRPDIKLPTSCENAIDELIGASYRELFIQKYVDGQGHGCDNDCGVGKTLMCHNAQSHSSNNNGIYSGGKREQCVKNKDVNKKLQTGDWTLGPCPANAKSAMVIGEEGFELTAQPNPFSETTTIKFRMTGEERVSLVVYNVAGEEVSKLFEGLAERNQLYEFEFKAENNPDGMYFYRLVTESGDVYIRKLVQTKQ